VALHKSLFVPRLLIVHVRHLLGGSARCWGDFSKILGRSTRDLSKQLLSAYSARKVMSASGRLKLAFVCLEVDDKLTRPFNLTTVIFTFVTLGILLREARKSSMIQK